MPRRNCYGALILQTFRPRLALPASHITEAHSEKELIALFERSKRPAEDIALLDRADQNCSVQAIKIGNLVITESDLPPAMIKTKIDPQLAVAIPVSGRGTFKEGAREAEFLPSHITLFPFKQPMSFKINRVHYITFQFDIMAVNNALSMHSGHDVIDSPVLARTGTFTGRLGAVNYHDQLLLLVTLINSCGGDSGLLSRIGFEDVVTKTVADFLMTTSGKAVDQEYLTPTKRSDKSVDVICDFIATHIGQPLTTPQMERLTGLTGRAINYAFHARYGMSPQQWQRDYLLDKAREELLSPDNTRSIKQVAYDLGFSSPSSFSAHYQRKFGEQPSASLHSGSASATPFSDLKDI